MKKFVSPILLITVICFSAISSEDSFLDKALRAIVVIERIERLLKQTQEEELRKKETQEKKSSKKTGG